MRDFKKSTTVFPIAIATLMLMFFAIPLQAQQTMKVSGKITAQNTKDETFNVDNTKDHMMSLAISSGTNQNTGDQKFMDNAQISNGNFSDLTQGNGNQQGYIVFVTGPDTTIAKWEGKVTTTSEPRASKDPKFEGTFNWIYGSGKFKNISGKGTYSGNFMENNQYVVEWKGEYTLGK